MIRTDQVGRRRFLATLGALVQGARQTPAAPGVRAGIHLGSLESALDADPDGTLRKVRELGYAYVELAPPRARLSDPVRLRRSLEAAGLQAVSRHVRMPDLFVNPKLILRECQLLGSRHVVCAEVPPEQRATATGIDRVADRLNAVAALAESVGMRLAVHIDADDFRARGPLVPYERLVERTNPALVKLQLDCAALARGGRDPIEEVRRVNGRLASVHLNNLATASPNQPADLGAGRLDIPAILRRASASGATYYFVDDAPSGKPLEQAGTSVTYLSTVSF